MPAALACGIDTRTLANLAVVILWPSSMAGAKFATTNLPWLDPAIVAGRQLNSCGDAYLTAGQSQTSSSEANTSWWRTFQRPPADTLAESQKNRYQRLVAEHLSPAQRTAAGLRALPAQNKPASSTQAAWRFYNDPSITLQQVFSPILAETKTLAQQACHDRVLIACDWCNLHYNDHCGKQGRVPLAHSKDLGYEMFSGLAMSDQDGQPLGPLWLELRDQQGVHSTRHHDVRSAISVLDEVVGSMRFAAGLNLGRVPVFILDAECDSIAHLRQWDAAGMTFIVRGQDKNTAIHDQTRRSLKEIGKILHSQGDFQYARTVTHEGRRLQQWEAETKITITRPARPERKGEPRRSIPGDPLELRLVTSELRDDAGDVVATWYLQTNAAASVQASTVVLWYYWRWRIEDYHKLLKSAGQEVEAWGQETCGAIARRLAVASMACLIVWSLERDKSEQAEQVRRLLVRLSGRQMSRKRPATAPAMLAGLWVLLAFNDALQTYDLEFLRHCAATVRDTIASKFM